MERERMNFLCSLVILFFVISLSLGLSPSTRRPNFLLLQSDSMDGRTVDPDNRVSYITSTPNLDRLAANGVNFVNAYTHSPLCVPSRAAMWTGRRVDQVHAWDNMGGLCRTWDGYKCINENITGVYDTFDMPFRNLGFNVSIQGRVDQGGGYGGFHNSTPKWMMEGWTREANIHTPTMPGPGINPNSSECCSEDWNWIDGCIEWLLTRNESESESESESDSTPFFLHCGVYIPHNPYVSNATWIKTVNESALFLPEWVDYDKMHIWDQRMILSKCTLAGDCTGQNATTDQIQLLRRLYYAMIAEMDTILGTLIDTLIKIGQYDNTYIIFTSDHGELALEHRQWEKNAMYEGSTRVPLIVAGPGIRKGAIVSNLTTLLDIFPTIMDLYNLPTPEGLGGQSLIPFLLENATDDARVRKIAEERRDWLMVQYHGMYVPTAAFMIRQGDWKYITYGNLPPFQNYTPQLFNVSGDPAELNNVFSFYPGVAKQMEGLLLSVIDYNAVDQLAKREGREKYLAWQADGHMEDRWTAYWKIEYIGFNATDQTLALDWIAGN